MANPPRCGQFTFFFPRCSHATSHPFHLSSLPFQSQVSSSQILCNSNCTYTRMQNHWFYAYQNARCSFCGLGKDHGFGTLHPLPTGDRARMDFFERLRKEGVLGCDTAGEGGGAGELFKLAAAQYNEMVDRCEVLVKRIERTESGLGDGKFWRNKEKKRREKKKRFYDRLELRKLRARRRTENWVRNIREEQYAAVKKGWKLGRRPFILAKDENPLTDFYIQVPKSKLPQPVDNCIWCQYPLSDLTSSGRPTSLPCGHTYHQHCVSEFFSKRASSSLVSEQEGIYQCPLCKIWFQDVRELPDFYEKYRGLEHEFDSQAKSSVLSDSEAEDMIGDPKPPWFVERKKEDPILPFQRRFYGINASVLAEESGAFISPEELRPDVGDFERSIEVIGREGLDTATLSSYEFSSETDDATFWGRESDDGFFVDQEFGVLNNPPEAIPAVEDSVYVEEEHQGAFSGMAILREEDLPLWMRDAENRHRNSEELTSDLLQENVLVQDSNNAEEQPEVSSSPGTVREKDWYDDDLSNHESADEGSEVCRDSTTPTTVVEDSDSDYVEEYPAVPSSSMMITRSARRREAACERLARGNERTIKNKEMG